MLVLGLGDGFQNKEIMNIWVLGLFQIMKSGFYYTILKQKKAIKLLQILFKYISTIRCHKMTIIIAIFLSYDSIMILLYFFLWFSIDRSSVIDLRVSMGLRSSLSVERSLSWGPFFGIDLPNCPKSQQFIQKYWKRGL